MKVLLSVTLGKIPNEVNRQIEVDENISLKDLCEYIIISMNGSKIPIYEFECGSVTYFPYVIDDTKNEKSMENLLFKDLNLKKNKCFTLEYNFHHDYFFDIVVDSIYESGEKEMFKVLYGKGNGVLDDCDLFDLELLFKAKKEYLKKFEIEYLEKKFDCVECNQRIADYMENKKKMYSPKSYIFNVSLYGFEKEIKRKVVVNNNVTINYFCRCVVLAMNGDLSHAYGIKVGKNYLSEDYDNLELCYLNLKEKQRLKIVYDVGDNWVFNLTLSKIVDGYGCVDFEVISGKGYGIIDDVGGIMGLEYVFNGKDTSWGKYDINDFDLDKCNRNVRK